MNKTNISYLTHTWNPIAMRCTPCSPGCANCWHLKMADRLAANPAIFPNRGRAYAGLSAPLLMDEELTAPMRLKKPAQIGVQFMGDLFHEDVPESFICSVLEHAAEATQHTFLFLTKRPDRMLEISGRPWYGHHIPHFWLGVTVCNQAEADAKIPVLLSIPAAVRWLSVEPMLSNVWVPTSYMPRLQWVVVGCESGPRRRPCNIEWVRSVVAQCKAAGVPVFVKQLDIGGKVISELTQFPADLQIRAYPEVKL